MGAPRPIFNNQYSIFNLKRWLPLLLWMGFIFYMSAQPKPPPIPLIEGLLDKVEWSDKIKHFFGYGVLGGITWWSLGDGLPKWRRFWLAVGISAVYGATDEFHQRYVPGRSCDVFDWTADVIGALAGAIVMCIGGARLGRAREARQRLRS